MKKLVILTIYLAACLSSFAQTKPTAAGPRIPSVELKTLEGDIMTTKEFYNEDRPFIVSLWATWCKPCIEELEAISLVYDEWVEELGVKLYAVSIDDSRSASKVAPFVRAKGWDYIVLQDVNSDLKRALNVVDVPFLCIYNKDGEMIWSHTSYATGGEEEVYTVLKNLVKSE